MNKLPKNVFTLQFAGELILPKCPDKQYLGSFQKYELFFEFLANMEREERIINYKFLNGLMLTSHAKKSLTAEERKKLFDKKNEIIFNLANNKTTRRKLAFKYLVSTNFKVTEYCPECIEKNKDKPLKKCKHCEKCKIDKDYYNILSIHHKFSHGSATLFLSNDRIHKIENLNIKQKAKLKDFKEEILYKKFHYNAKNLHSFNLPDVLEMQQKCLNLN